MPLPFHRRRLDPDAADFCRRSGATDRAAINAFVKGVKDLGLWDKMVCWPLRSSQNAGFGSTAYSLGGLGTFDGTRVNGPGWTADGLTVDALGKGVELPDNALLYNARSGFAAFKSTDVAANQQLIEFQSGLSTGWYYLFRFQGNAGFGAAGLRFVTTRNGTGSINDNIGRTVNLTDFQTGSFTMDDSSDNVFRNGSIEVGGARVGLAALNATGSIVSRIIFANSVGLTGAFASVSSTKWSDAQVAALHSLYKSTLGTGLGLP